MGKQRSMKVLIKNQQDQSICLIFTNGYWILPEVASTENKHAEAELKKVTGLKEVKVIGEKHAILLAISKDDLQENLDILIGWFNGEDAIKSIEEKEKGIVQDALAS